ncbi:inositol monophosphatase family protein [Halanaerocella petrolearia]
MIDKREVLNKVKKWVRQVGEIQLEKMNSDIRIRTKSGAIDLVTEIDQLSEEILVRNIKKDYPEHSILAEEGGSEETDSDYRWIIDPIDGTTNYAQQFPIFSISIALQYQEDTILGIVYVPKLDELYSAIKGEGAFLNGQKLQISATTQLQQAVLATGFPYDRAEDTNNNLDNLKQFVTRVRGIRRVGTAAFDLVNVAAGRFDGYWELKLNLWDIAAGVLLVEEAGGKVYTFEKDKGITVVAGNEEICQKILEEIKE